MNPADWLIPPITHSLALWERVGVRARVPEPCLHLFVDWCGRAQATLRWLTRSQRRRRPGGYAGTRLACHQNHTRRLLTAASGRLPPQIAGGSCFDQSDARTALLHRSHNIDHTACLIAVVSADIRDLHLHSSGHM